LNSTLQAFFDEIAELPHFAGISPIGLPTRGHYGDTPLHVAAIRGDVAMIRALLDAGAEINVNGELGYTPLHEAVEQGHAEAVRVLVERGASKDVLTEDGQSPLETAALSGDAEITRLLSSE
jgi:uncharacterized protein